MSKKLAAHHLQRAQHHLSEADKCEKAGQSERAYMHKTLAADHQRLAECHVQEEKEKIAKRDEPEPRIASAIVAKGPRGGDLRLVPRDGQPTFAQIDEAETLEEVASLIPEDLRKAIT